MMSLTAILKLSRHLHYHCIYRNGQKLTRIYIHGITRQGNIRRFFPSRLLRVRSDPEFYDDFSDVITAVGFITPPAGLFHPHINYLLCISGQVEIVVLGASVSGLRNGTFEVIREPLFRISTDNEQITVIEDVNGRIIIGTKSGSVLEIAYWSEKPSWFRLSRPALSCSDKYCFSNESKVYAKLINHSSWKLSVLLPAMIVNGFMFNAESITQIATDASRNLIYSRSENSLIVQYELQSGQTIRKLAYVTEDYLVGKASRLVKSVDKSQFRNIIQLCPLNAGYGPLQLIAVTQSGVRLYFTDGLQLSHIRMPPASPLATFGKINNVRLCCESRNSILMICGTTIDSQALYTISPDSFFVQDLVETVSVTWASNGSWVLLPLDKPSNVGSQSVIQTQHIEPSRRFIMVSVDNIVMLELPSPIQHFRSIIEQNSSPSCSDIRAWVAHFGAEETIYAAMVVASDKRNGYVANKAVDTAMFYLNEAVKNRTSNAAMGTSMTNPLHDVLCMYTARILRPLWDKSIADQSRHHCPSSDESQPVLISAHEHDSLGWYLHQLVYLHDFIRDNYSRIKAIDGLRLPGTCTNLSLELMELLKMTIEIVGLWSIVTEHADHEILRRLPQEIQAEVLRCTVKQLLLPTKRPVLVAVISALLEHYLVDGSSTEAIVRALHSICPSIYRREDVLCSQANELLVRVDSMPLDNDPDRDRDRDRLLIEAVRLYEQVGSSLDVRSVAHRLRTVGCAWGAVHLCLHVAHARDPDGLAFVCLRENRRPHTAAEITAVEGRTDAYKFMLECLNSVVEHVRQIPFPAMMPDSSQQLFGSSDVRSSELLVILRAVFDQRDDVMAHYEVYSWMIDNGLADEILAFPSDNLESFLQRRLLEEPTHVRLKELLWRHYEAIGRQLDAARVLDDMAVGECAEFGLDERLECLSRAIVFVKGALGNEALAAETDYVKELEDKVAIAQLQKQIIEEAGPSRPSIAAELNSRLHPVCTLLTEFADPCGLVVSKLLILKVGGHVNKDNIRLIWEEFLEREMDRQSDVSNLITKQVGLKHAVTAVVQRFKDSPAFLPLDVVVHHLEEYCSRFSFPDDWVVILMQEADVPPNDVLSAYCDLVRGRNYKRNMHRVFTSVGCVVDWILHLAPPRDRLINYNLCLDLVTMSLSHLQSRGDAASSVIVGKLAACKSLLEKRF